MSDAPQTAPVHQALLGALTLQGILVPVRIITRTVAPQCCGLGPE